MTYVDGFVAAVPTANKQAYLDMAARVAPIFRKHGALAVIECWGDDVPEGKINSFHTAVMRKDDETVIFSWIVWPSKAVRDGAHEASMADMNEAFPEQPRVFDGQRMIWGGFEMILNA
jgi:uncharacterized protein YbaA (DUF1428 family)